MPQNKFATARYRLIDQLLGKQKFVKSSQIVELCKSRLGYEVTQRTIQMDIQHMKYDTFLEIYAPIEYCPRNKAYYYEDPTYSPQSFSPKELRVLENIYKLVCQQVNPQDVFVLKGVIRRIKKRMAK